MRDGSVVEEKLSPKMPMRKVYLFVVKKPWRDLNQPIMMYSPILAEDVEEFADITFQSDRVEDLKTRVFRTELFYETDLPRFKRNREIEDLNKKKDKRDRARDLFVMWAACIMLVIGIVMIIVVGIFSKGVKLC